MLRWRLLTAAVAIPFLLWLIYRGPVWCLNVFVLSMTFIALREYAAMALTKVRGGTTAVTAGGMTIALAIGARRQRDRRSPPASSCVSAACSSARSRPRKTWSEASAPRDKFFSAASTEECCLPHFIWVRALPENGPGWVTFILACVMAGDAGGYFGGRAFGRRKLWPAVSPKKTVEGSIASFFASLFTGMLAARLVLPQVGWLESLLVSAVVNVLAQLGDLLESMLKRAYHATDSGWIFPGHGGVLDRTDSLVLPVVFIYYYAILTHGVFVPR